MWGSEKVLEFFKQQSGNPEQFMRSSWLSAAEFAVERNCRNVVCVTSLFVCMED